MIEIRGLTAGYNGEAVFRDVSLDFVPGEVLVLAGPNGCGKSTLLKTVAGIEPVMSGEILFDGVPMSRLSPRETAQKAAYMPQERGVPSISVRRMALHGRFPYLSYPRRYRQEDYGIVDAALERADASELAARLVPELSGGQRQRAYLAMALAQDTETIMMDEPTAFLDIGHQLRLMDTARTLAGEGRAVVIVLHDLCLALKRADRMAVLAEGSLAALGRPEDIFSTGVVDRVFGVRLRRVGTPEGWQYYFA